MPRAEIAISSCKGMRVSLHETYVASFKGTQEVHQVFFSQGVMCLDLGIQKNHPGLRLGTAWEKARLGVGVGGSVKMVPARGRVERTERALLCLSQMQWCLQSKRRRKAWLPVRSMSYWKKVLVLQPSNYLKKCMSANSEIIKLEGTVNKCLLHRSETGS